MSERSYVIVGGGMAAAAAANAIREVDPRGAVTVLTAESDPPYDRPPLSKGLWKDQGLRSVWRQLPDAVDVRLATRAVALDLQRQEVHDDRGGTHRWDKLLLATGGSPRRLPGGDDDVIYYRTLADYRRARELVASGQCLAVVGGGFIGAEMAAALAMVHREPLFILRGTGVGSSLFPGDLSLFLKDYYRERGVAVVTRTEVVAVARRNEGLALTTRRSGGDEREVVVDGALAGIGITPNVELARSAGLTVDDGIVVDELLTTSHPDVLAAGDVASFPSAALGRRLRVEHEDAANTMGEAAGRTMAGEPTPYRHLPLFYSDLFDLGFEAVGLVDACLETVRDWREPYREGVVYYLEEGRVRGVLLWNVWEQVDAARELIADPGPFTARDLRGRIG